VTERHVLSFPVGRQRFNYRVAAVIIADGHVLSNFWVPLSGGALAAMNLLPRWLPGFLENLPESLTHIVHDERQASGGAVSAP
jgi:hypothetical protein